MSVRACVINISWIDLAKHMEHTLDGLSSSEHYQTTNTHFEKTLHASENTGAQQVQLHGAYTINLNNFSGSATNDSLKSSQYLCLAPNRAATI